MMADNEEFWRELFEKGESPCIMGRAEVTRPSDNG